MKNNTLREIGEVIKNENLFLIFTHISGDADTIGSATALCRAIRNMGKEAYIAVEDEIAKNLLFLDWDKNREKSQKVEVFCEPMIVFYEDLLSNGNHVNVCGREYVSICVDCGDISRFPKREQLFNRGKIKVCIDHHVTSKPFCDYNFIEPNAAATAEIIYFLLKENSFKIDEEIGKSIFAGITTDTGNFQYSNTRKETHEIVASLYDIRNSYNDVSVEIYERAPVSRLLLQSDIIGRLKIFSSGKGCISYVTKEMVEKRNADMDHSDGAVGTLRSIDGVEVAALLKEKLDGTIKVSLRSKNYLDVGAISQRLGGGGHRKAAGFSLDLPMEESIAFVIKELEKELD